VLDIIPLLAKDYVFVEECKVYYENKELKFNPFYFTNKLNKNNLKSIDIISKNDKNLLSEI
jgi:hypothetical protein